MVSLPPLKLSELGGGSDPEMARPSPSMPYMGRIHIRTHIHMYTHARAHTQALSLKSKAILGIMVMDQQVVLSSGLAHSFPLPREPLQLETVIPASWRPCED